MNGSVRTVMFYQWALDMRGKWWILLLLFAGCKKEATYSSIEVFGHAGMGLKIQDSLYHDNSKEAIEFALGIEGCNGVEVDVHLSKDGQLWLYHDNELADNTTGASCIPENDSNELSLLYYKTLAKEKLARLNDLNWDYLDGKSLFLDIRHLNSCSGQFVSRDDFLTAILNSNVLDHSSVQVWCILSNPEWIDEFHAAGLNVLFSASGQIDHLELTDTYPELKGLVVKNSETTKEEVDQLHSQGKKVFIFEIRSPKGIRSALRKLPDGVITDDIRTTLIEKY